MILRDELTGQRFRWEKRGRTPDYAHKASRDLQGYLNAVERAFDRVMHPPVAEVEEAAPMADIGGPLGRFQPDEAKEVARRLMWMANQIYNGRRAVAAAARRAAAHSQEKAIANGGSP